MKKGIDESKRQSEIFDKLDEIVKSVETGEIIEKISSEIFELVVSVTARAFKQGYLEGGKRMLKDVLDIDIPENLQ